MRSCLACRRAASSHFSVGHATALRLLDPGPGTLLRVSLTGGGPRELLDDVIAADWKPEETNSPSCGRDKWSFLRGPRSTASTVQVRARLARWAATGPGRRARAGRRGKTAATAIVLLDRSGQKTTLSSGWGDLTDAGVVAFRRRGVVQRKPARSDFTIRPCERCTTDGKRTRDPSFSIGFSVDTRCLLDRPRVAVEHCLSDGDARASRRATLSREMSGGSMVRRPKLSRRTDEPSSWAKCSEAEARRDAIYLRGTDGSDAVRLGDGFPEDLSPDGKWVLAAPVRPGSTGSSCRPGRTPGEPYRPDPSSVGSRRTFCRTDVGLCSEGGRRDRAGGFIFRMSKAEWSGRSPRRTRRPLGAGNAGWPVRDRSVRGQALSVSGRRRRAGSVASPDVR